MADGPFNGTDFTFDGTALEVVDLTFTKGELPRVDITHAGSSFKAYASGIPEADSVSVTHLDNPPAVGATGSFAAGTITISGTFKVESVETSGSIDNAITYTTTFVRTV